jgi:TraX protein
MVLTRGEWGQPSAAQPPVGTLSFSSLERFNGAPLDVVKLFAAAFMVIDHVNFIFLGHDANIFWKLGRISFPLFAFALVCNLRRGAKVSDYVARLVALAVVSQPIYAIVFGYDDGDIVFTLAVGAVIATLMCKLKPLPQHGVFLAGTAAIFCPYAQARSGLDFGLAGMLFPAALFMTLAVQRAHALWLVLILVGLNWYFPHPWQFAPISAALFAAFGSLAVLGLALLFRKRARFLPRYAFYAFYPGHLLILGALHALM